MTTQYTTILKLALPVQGELSGTWGDVVNDNITQMVEQAIAGKATINSWTANAHTLTTADGTTSESRCAILELTDTGTALTGAGTVTCPTNTKLYIVDNNTAEIITIKTAAGTGVAVPVGKTMLVYCDGTNVVEGVTHANSLSLGTSTVTVNAIDTATDLGAGSSSNSNLPTQLAVKTYVDGQIAATNELSEVLAAGNVTGANDIDVENAQKVQFRDTAIYINSSADGQLDIVADGEVQIDTALVDINGNLDVSGTTNIGGSVSFTKNAIAGVAISTTSRASNTVTVTTSAVHGLTSGDLVNINGVADTSFNGYFTVAVSSTTVFTYSQTGADGSSTGGTSTEVVYNLNASGTALNWMNGPLNIAANSGIDGLEITQSGAGNGLHVTGTTGLVGNVDVTGTVTADGLTVDDTSGTVGLFNSTAVASTLAINNTHANAWGSNIAFRTGGTDAGYLGSIGSLLGNTDQDLTAYSTAGNGFRIYTNGNNERLRVTSAGDVGIGTASPATKLHVADASDSNAQIRINGSTSTVYSRLYSDNNGVLAISTDVGNQVAGSYMMFEVKGTERIRIDASGNVGIGSATANHFSTAGATNVLGVKGTSGGLISVAATGTNFSGVDLGTDTTRRGGIYSLDGSHLAFYTNPTNSGGSLTERMRIDSSGNIGINGASGGATLQVNQATLSYIDIKSDNALRMRMYGDSTQAILVSEGVPLIFKYGSTETMRIDSSGRVLIGTATEGEANADDLTIENTSGDCGITIRSATTGGSKIFFSDGTSGTAEYDGYIIYDHNGNNMQFGQGNSENMRIDSSGNLLVGLTEAAYLVGDSGVQLYASGGARFGADGTSARNLISFVNGTDGTPAEVGAIQTNGSSTSYLTSSDQRLKDNIVDAPSASDDIDAIQVRSFDWKADGSHQKYGMVAQELQSVAPEAVSATEDPEEMMGVDYSKLVPMMLKEIQSLRARVAELESK